MNNQELTDEVKSLREHVGKIYDRIFEINNKLADNSIQDAKVEERVKLTTGQKVKSGVK